MWSSCVTYLIFNQLHKMTPTFLSSPCRVAFYGTNHEFKMSLRFQKPGSARRRHFIKEWRAHRGLTMDRLADRLDISKATLSRLESGRQPYTQDTLEALAEALSCEPADLIMRDPTAPGAIWSIWDKANPAQRQQIEAIARALVEAA
jgi:transcriptional regulator with XRE-family HTH domain